MSYHRHFTIIILTFFLFTSCLCSETTRSRRQKRGIVKMMMHIMWDPVRLIRYWYAYDVTKEIAKSWRKIIPTMLFLPITQQMPYSHGLSKYVHPTVGIRDSNKKIKAKNPNIPFSSYYEGSAGNIKPVAVLPAMQHQALPPKYNYEPPVGAIQYYSSRETENVSNYKPKNVPHVIVSHVPFKGDTDDDNHYSMAHYFVGDGSSHEEIPTSNVLFPKPMHYNKDGIRSSSNYFLASSDSENIQNLHSVLEQSHADYVEAQGSYQIANGQTAGPVIHAGQEVHIVLHPIPVRNFDSHSMKGIPNEQDIHFVPVQAQSNKSYGIHLGVSPIFLKSVPQNGAEYDLLDENTTSSPDRNDWLNLNSSDDVNMVEGKANASKENTKSQVIWISQNSEDKSKIADKNESELKPEETARRTVSVHKNYPQKFTRYSSTFNRHNINLDRLKEDLKHGTPVLIPFNRNTYSTDYVTDTSVKNPVIFPNDENENHKNHDGRTHSTEVYNVPVISESGINSSSEQFAEKNSTQKLILFLKRKNP